MASSDSAVAAWDSYVVSTPTIFMELFDLLRTRYELAIENISKGYVTKTHLQPVESLSHHLLLEYQLAEYHVKSSEGQNSLIAKYFNKALPDQRGTAVWALSERTHKIAGEWQRAKDLWTWRLEAASNANHSIDFKPEMEAFSQLLFAAPDTENMTTLWPLLEGFLPYLADAEHWNRIWHNLQKFLAKEVERDPSGAIRFYNLMHESRGEPMQYYGDEARKILNFGAFNQDSRKETLLLIDSRP